MGDRIFLSRVEVRGIWCELFALPDVPAGPLGNKYLLQLGELGDPNYGWRPTKGTGRTESFPTWREEAGRPTRREEAGRPTKFNVFSERVPTLESFEGEACVLANYLYVARLRGGEISLINAFSSRWDWACSPVAAHWTLVAVDKQVLRYDGWAQTDPPILREAFSAPTVPGFVPRIFVVDQADCVVAGFERACERSPECEPDRVYTMYGAMFVRYSPDLAEIERIIPSNFGGDDCARQKIPHSYKIAEGGEILPFGKATVVDLRKARRLASRPLRG